MNLSPYEIALIAGGFTIIGVLIGAWIGYRNALKLYSISEFNKAAIAFRNAFLPQLILLRHNAKIRGANAASDLGEFLYSYYLDHLEAINVFQPFLSPEDRKGLNTAWKEYYCHPEEPDTPWYEQYSVKTSGTSTTEKNLRAMALERIENIVKYAEPK